MKAILIWLAYTSSSPAPHVYTPWIAVTRDRCEVMRATDNSRQVALNAFKHQGITPDRVEGLCVPFTNEDVTTFNTTEKVAK